MDMLSKQGIWWIRNNMLSFIHNSTVYFMRRMFWTSYIWIWAYLRHSSWWNLPLCTSISIENRACLLLMHQDHHLFSSLLVSTSLRWQYKEIFLYFLERRGREGDNIKLYAFVTGLYWYLCCLIWLYWSLWGVRQERTLIDLLAHLSQTFSTISH